MISLNIKIIKIIIFFCSRSSVITCKCGDSEAFDYIDEEPQNNYVNFSKKKFYFFKQLAQNKII